MSTSHSLLEAAALVSALGSRRTSMITCQPFPSGSFRFNTLIAARDFIETKMLLLLFNLHVPECTSVQVMSRNMVGFSSDSHSVDATTARTPRYAVLRPFCLEYT